MQQSQDILEKKQQFAKNSKNMQLSQDILEKKQQLAKKYAAIAGHFGRKKQQFAKKVAKICSSRIAGHFGEKTTICKN